MKKNKKITDYYSFSNESEMNDIRNSKLYKMNKEIEEELSKVKVYLLCHIIMDYHGGTRFNRLGIYTTKEKAKKAWKLYTKEYEYDSDSDECEIIEIKLDQKPESWVGKEIK